MEMNDYVLEVIADCRLAERRAEALSLSRARAARPAPRPLRVALGHALIRMGNRLLGVRRDSLRMVSAGETVVVRGAEGRS